MKIRRISFGIIPFLFALSLSLGQVASVEYGQASFYADALQGNKTASGETYYHNEYTAAHQSLPFNTWVRVTNLDNQKSVLVRINDRGPFIQGRIIDLSKYAARDLDMIKTGVARVKIEVLPKITEPESAYSAFHQNEKNPGTFGFYKMSIEPYTPKGFGVQIRSYHELDHLFKESEQWPGEPNPHFIIHMIGDANARAYKVIIGEFKNRKEAEKLRDNIRTEFPDCFIVEF